MERAQDASVSLPVFDLVRVTKSRPGAEQYRLEIERLRVRRGEALAVVGASGCGKSTALDLLACALRPDEPEEDARFVFSPDGEREIDIFDAWRRGGSNALAADRMRHLGYVLQTGGLLPFITAADNIVLTCKVLGIVHERITAIRHTVEELGIEHLLSKYPSQLSVGERQRVAIARALAHGPAVILADEPTAALDPEHSSTVMELFLRLARHEGATVIMVSHDQALARETGFTLVPIPVRREGDTVVATVTYDGAPEEAGAGDDAATDAEENRGDEDSRTDGSGQETSGQKTSERDTSERNMSGEVKA